MQLKHFCVSGLAEEWKQYGLYNRECDQDLSISPTFVGDEVHVFNTDVIGAFPKQSYCAGEGFF